MVVSFLVCVTGALVYAFAPGKAARLGEVAYFVGLLWLVYSLGGKVIHLP